MREKLKKFPPGGLIDFYDADLIADWTNEYFSAAVYVLEACGEGQILGLQTWEHWSHYDANDKYQFVSDEQIKSYIEQLRSFFLGHAVKKIARLVGLSGLGKTRLALEAFRPPTDPSADPMGTALGLGVVYVRVPNPTVLSQVIEWRNQSVEGLIVVDDCDRKLHDQLAQEIKHRDSKLNLLTLDFVAEEESDATDPILTLRQCGNEVIRGILKQSYQGLRDTDLDRIVEFAQGFPQMAVLLADARLQDLPDMGSLKKNELVQRLLWGHEKPDRRGRTVIEACALFDVLGINDSVIDHSKFVAKEICRDSFQEFYKHVVSFEKRGILERRGDFVRVRPKPLAVRLAADWWKSCHPDIAKRLFHLEMPPGLLESLCSRMSMLDFVEETRQIAADLCGETGPFGQAEVLNSERGSRCFCSLVEVNPAAALSALLRVFGTLTREELLKIGPGRRSLVRSLEKLSCRRPTFDGAARLLLAFAGAENERWANNATGCFLQLFNVYLSGTEAPPIDRLNVAFDALRSDEREIRELGVRALGRALDARGHIRAMGAEFQGSGPAIQEWRPRTYGDIFDYWDFAQAKLIEFASSNRELGELAAGQLINQIRPHIDSGRIDQVQAAIEKAVQPYQSLWPKALEQLQHVLQFPSKTMTSALAARVNKLIAALQPKDLSGRIRLFVSVPPFENIAASDGTIRYLDSEKAQAFADECAQRINEFLPLVGQISSGEQRQAFAFGTRLGNQVANPDVLISAATYALREAPTATANSAFIAGILHSVQSKNPALVQSVLDKFAEDPRLARYAVRITHSIRISPTDLNRLLAPVRNGMLSPRELASLGYGQALAHLSFNQLAPFISGLIAEGLEPAEAAFEIIFYFLYPKRAIESDFRPLVRTIYLLPGMLARVLTQSTSHVENFLEVAQQLVTDGSEENVAKKLLDEAIIICEGSNHPYSYIRSFKSLIATIVQAYRDAALARISQSIEMTDPLKRYRLQHLIGRGFDSNEPSLMSSFPVSNLERWCTEHPDTVPQFLARVLPPLEKKEDQTDWSSSIRMIIDKFGDKKGVLEELAANMGTFSSVGSSAPYYEGYLAPLDNLLFHRSKRVSRWAAKQLEWHRKMIAEEKKHEQERDFGIFR